MTKQDRINLLYAAQANLQEAIDNINEALGDTNYADHADAYIIGHLENWKDNVNRYDYGIPKYIELLEEGEVYNENEIEE